MRRKLFQTHDRTRKTPPSPQSATLHQNPIGAKISPLDEVAELQSLSRLTTPPPLTPEVIGSPGQRPGRPTSAATSASGLSTTCFKQAWSMRSACGWSSDSMSVWLRAYVCALQDRILDTKV
jgi:hypothetical protein